MKKFVGIVLLSSLALVALTSCGEINDTSAELGESLYIHSENESNESTGAYEEPEQIETPELKLQVAEVSDELLNTFTYLHEFTYSDIHGHNIVTDLNLVIWANIPLRDFAVISFGNYSIDDEIIYIPIDTFGQIDELTPGHAFVINSYYTKGTVSWSGVTFIDESGKRRYFAINECHGETGWLIWEFENRTHELPSDWTPWWEEGLVDPVNYIVVYSNELPDGFAGFSFFLDERYTFKPEPWSIDSGWFIISNGIRERVMSIGQFPNIGMTEKEYIEDLASILNLAYEPPTEYFPFYSFQRFIGGSDSLGVNEIEMQRFLLYNGKGGMFLIQILLFPEEWEGGYADRLIQALKTFRVLPDLMFLPE